MSENPLYERDFYAWANEQAALLREGRFAQADIDHIAQEIESMGKTEKRELVSRLIVLLKHLLKWGFQPTKRTTSWEVSIKVQRALLADHLDDNPSLKPLIPDAVSKAYPLAALEAADETKLPTAAFPKHCPWPFELMMNTDFWPDARSR